MAFILRAIVGARYRSGSKFDGRLDVLASRNV
jgi:hypothetical protein